jgi:hypothetical protein
LLQTQALEGRPAGALFCSGQLSGDLGTDAKWQLSNFPHNIHIRCTICMCVNAYVCSINIRVYIYAHANSTGNLNT